MPIAHSVFKQTVFNVSTYQLQQRKIEICCKMIQFPYQLTCEANHFVSSTKRSFTSALCWSALVCVFDSVPAYYLTHDNLLAHTCGAFSVIFTSELQFSYWFTYKTVFLNLNGCNF